MECHEIICGDAQSVLETLPEKSIQLTVTSPPYFQQRDYGVSGQIGQEGTVEEYVERLVSVFTEVRRVTKPTGCCFVVLGDTFCDGNLLLVPHRVAIALGNAGWILRNDIIFHKLDPPPESVRTRWRTGHEHIFFFTKQRSGYVFNDETIRVPYSEATLRRWGNGQSYGGEKSKSRTPNNEPRIGHGRKFKLNPNGCIPTDVWSLACGNNFRSHYAGFSTELVQKMILACSNQGDTVLDPFAGSGTTCRTAVANGRSSIGIELNPEYAELAGESETDTEKVVG